MTQPANRRLVTEAKLAADLAGLTVADASTATKGIVELATNTETTTGTDTVRAVTPAGVKAVADTKETAGAAAAAQAFAVQRANHTGTQAATTITGLAPVATSGAYGDLSGKPTIPTGQTITADPTVLQAFAPDSGRLLPAPPVTTKVNMMYNGLSNGTDTSTTYRTWVDVGVDCRDIRLVFVNSYTDTSIIVDTPGPNPISVKASLELESNGQPAYTKGTLVPAYFGRDGRTASIQPGGVLISDPIPGDFKAGQGFYVDAFVSVASAGMKWPVGRWNAQGGSYTMDGTQPGADYTDGATGASPGGVGYVSNNRAYSFMPVAIIGTPVNRAARSVVVFGHSIPTGTANAGNITDGSYGGYVSRAFKGKAGLINLAQPSEKATEFLATNSHNTRGRLVQCGATDAFVDYVNTQLFGDPGSTFAIVTKAIQDIFAWVAARGFRVHTATCTPRSTSTDAWATTTNQTTNAKDALRQQVNAWLLAMAPQNGSGLAVTAGTAGAVPNPYLYSVHDVAAQVESAPGSGLWKVGCTGDGVHPNETGSAAMATAINTTAVLS